MAAIGANKTTESKKMFLLSMTKAMAVAYAITCIVFLLYAILLTYTDMGESNISLVALLCTVVCAAVAGFDTAKSAGEKGLIWGLVAGLVYALILFVVSLLCAEGFQLGMGNIATLAIALAGGGIGGVLGVNTKKK